MEPNVGITNNDNLFSNTGTDSLEKVFEKYKNHISVSCIKKYMTISELTFTFQSQNIRLSN